MLHDHAASSSTKISTVEYPEITKQTPPPPLPPAGGRGGGGSLFRTYEENIGVMTSTIRDLILAAEDEFGEVLVADAIRTAAKNNVHKWSYVDGILKRFRANGHTKPKLSSSASQKVFKASY